MINDSGILISFDPATGKCSSRDASRATTILLSPVARDKVFPHRPGRTGFRS